MLHTQLYARYPDIGCVLHTHSRVQTVSSRLFAAQGHVRLEGKEYVMQDGDIVLFRFNV